MRKSEYERTIQRQEAIIKASNRRIKELEIKIKEKELQIITMILNIDYSKEHIFYDRNQKDIMVCIPEYTFETLEIRIKQLLKEIDELKGSKE